MQFFTFTFMIFSVDALLAILRTVFLTFSMCNSYNYYYPNRSHIMPESGPVKFNKRSKDLGALLDSCSWDDIGNFLQTVSKTHCCRLNQVKSGLTLTKYLIHVSILDHIRHLNFDLSGSLKVKCECYWTPHI